MIVVFDTNIWIEELGLRSPSATVVRFFMKQKKARLALPEVVRLEVEANLREHLSSFIDALDKNHRQLLTAFGSLKALMLPSKAEVDGKIAEMLRSVDVEALDVPFSLESARSSFLKAIRKMAPSDKNQQFKDGVLWADCVALLAQDDVALVTSDKAFYREREYAKGLAASLAVEVEGKAHRLSLFSSVTELLGELRSNVSLNEDNLAAAALVGARSKVDDTLNRNQFALGGRLRVKRDLFVTEKPDRLFIEYWLEFAAVDTSNENRGDGVLLIHGDGMYDIAGGSLTEVRDHEVELTYRTPDGAEKTVRSVSVYLGGMALGHREVSHVVRSKIELPGGPDRNAGG